MDPSLGKSKLLIYSNSVAEQFPCAISHSHTNEEQFHQTQTEEWQFSAQDGKVISL